jgi:glucokinase
VTTIGIDVGGTKIAAGLVNFPQGRLGAQKVIPTAAQRGGRAVLEEVVGLIEALRPTHLDAIGIGLCELVDPTGRILSSNCIQWQNEPVTERLSRIAPTVIEADVRAAALAEALFGAGRSFRIFLYVTVGTGISACLMIEGRPFVGARGLTGTMASSALSIRCDACGQVHRSTLEEIASGPALVARFNHAGGQASSGQDVLLAAAAGDPKAIDVVTLAAQPLGMQIGLLVSTLDPEAVIIGGGLGLAQGLYWQQLVAATRAHIWSEAHRDLPILQAATGPMAGVLGAATAAWKKLNGVLTADNADGADGKKTSRM